MSILTLREIFYSYADGTINVLNGIINLKKANSTPSSVVLAPVNRPCSGY